MWRDDYQWSRRFLPEMKRVVGEHLIGEAPVEEDAERNTDLVVLKLEAVRIACRVRKADCAVRYGHQFTIRCSRPSGVKTELAKVVEGWGDYLLYGFANDREDALLGWLLGDLRVFRLWWSSYLVKNHGDQPGRLIPNRDGSSEFRAFTIADLPPKFVVARKLPIAEAA